MSEKFIVYMFDFGYGCPRYYIGMKSRCEIVDGVIFDRRGNEYWSSSSSSEWNRRIKKEKPKLEILECCETTQEAAKAEIEWQRKYLVDVDPMFYNMFIPPASTNFTWSDYGTYRHKARGTYKRLPINHPLVASGVYVGTNSGLKVHTEEFKKTLRERTKGNYFFGGQPNPEASAIGHKKWLATDEGKKWNKRNSENASRTFKGKPKSKEQRKKMSLSGKNKNKIVLYNINTGMRIVMNVSRYRREFAYKDDWKTMTSIKSTFNIMKKLTCPHCSKSGVVANMRRWHFDNCKKRSSGE